MNFLISVLKFFVGAASFTTNIVSLKKYLLAVLVNTLVCILLGVITFYYPFGGWIGLAINLFFVYAGGAYVATWCKAFGTNLDVFSAEDVEPEKEKAGEPERDNITFVNNDYWKQLANQPVADKDNSDVKS